MDDAPSVSTDQIEVAEEDSQVIQQSDQESFSRETARESVCVTERKERAYAGKYTSAYLCASACEPNIHGIPSATKQQQKPTNDRCRSQRKVNGKQ